VKTLPFALLKPTKVPKEGYRIELNGTSELLALQVQDGLHSAASLRMPTVLDIETKGNEAHNPESQVVGFSLSVIGEGGKPWAVYYTAEHWVEFLRLACHWHLPIAAHNGTFDWAYAYRDYSPCESRLNISVCTFAWYKHLAVEGWLNQRWGLKSAQVQLLGWEDTNETELDEWLILNGHHSSTKTSLDGVKEVDAWTWVESIQRFAKADKAEMWRAPAEILGKYCALDSISTMLLYKEVLWPAIQRFPVLQEHLEVYVIELIRQVIRQQLRGFRVDREKLAQYRERREQELADLKKQFHERPDVSPFVQERWRQLLENAKAAEPAQFLVQRWPKEPKKFKKNGEVSASWTNWERKTAEMTAAGPDISKNWLKWKEKVDALTVEDAFNIGSGPQLRALLYDFLGFPVEEVTDSGEPAVDGNALQGMGDVGKALDGISEVAKELTYVSKALEVSERDGCIHPQFRVPGTLTGRMSGAGGWNAQQQPKTKGYLECIVPREGFIFVDIDFAALEPHCLAEASRDETLLNLYRPGAAPNDVYIAVAAGIPKLGGPFLALGYDPKAPTKDAISRCKKELKGLRNVAKLLHLSASYGAGPKKIHQSLVRQGMQFSFEEVQELHRGYWELFAGVKRYERFLLDQWEATDGWFLNPMGRPIGVYADKTKDAVNRAIQSAGHDVTVQYIWHLVREIDTRGIECYPFIVDFHDETLWEVRIGQEQVMVEAMRAAMQKLNDSLNGYIRLSGEPDIGETFAKFKVEE